MLCEDVTFRSGPEGLEIAIQQAGKRMFPEKTPTSAKALGQERA